MDHKSVRGIKSVRGLRSKMDRDTLIELVRQSPHLYDKSAKGYSNISKKERTWSEISRTLGCSVPECKTTWRNLRERFVKEHKKYISQKNGATFIQSEIWEYYNMLGFLIPSITHRRSTYTGSDDEQSSDQIPCASTFEDDSDIKLFENYAVLSSDPSNSSNTTTFLPSTTLSADNGLTETHIPAVQITASPRPLHFSPSKCEYKPKDREDEDALFGKLVAAELRKCADDEKKSKKKQILDILFT